MTLHARIADKLGWSIEQTQSFSLPTLRDLVRPVSAKLAHEISLQLRSGAHISGPKYSRRIRRQPHVW